MLPDNFVDGFSMACPCVQAGSADSKLLRLMVLTVEKGPAMGRVEGKVALISGAARGQGRSHARLLAAEGADIIAVDICADIETNEYPLARPEDLDETARLVEKEGRRAYTEIADVRDRAALSAAIDRGVAEFGRLDIVVANAGICPLTAGLPPQAFVDAVDVDLVGVMNLVHASMKHLQAGASIIVTGSVAAFMASAVNTTGMDGGPGGAGYAFAKQVVAHYVNDLALALAPSSIRVNAIHPTNVNTDMLHSPPMYRAFRPDLKEPTREEAELVFPVDAGDAGSLRRARRHQRGGAISRQRRAPDTSPASSCVSMQAGSSRSNRGRRREGLSVPRGIIYVETMPASPDREEEYHKWYNDTHLEQICSVDGIVSARRFAPTDGEGPFIAIYELDCDDLDAAVRQDGRTRQRAARCPR